MRRGLAVHGSGACGRGSSCSGSNGSGSSGSGSSGRAASARNSVVRVFLALGPLVYGCGGDPPAPPATEEGQEPSESEERNFEDGLYERNVVFMTVDADSAIVVPWFFRVSSSAEGVERLTQGWLARAGLWEPFFYDQWSTGPTRTPFRIQPRGPMDLIIDDLGNLERILFAEGPRQLEVVIDEGISDWSGNRGETFRVHQGAALFGDQRVEGMVLDMNRARLRDSPEPGEWMFLTGPRRLAIVVEATGGSPAYAAWGRLGEEEFRWPNVEVEWSAVRSFEEARRNVPVAWQVRSPGAGALEGGVVLTIASAGMEQGTNRLGSGVLQAQTGEGPVLPVDGLFQVTGYVVLAGDSLEVRGLVRHVQP